MGGEGRSATSRRRRRRCLTCCGACCLVLILIVVVLVILAFTFFKAKDPKIHVDSITLESFQGSLVLNIPPTLTSLNVTLGLVVSVTNPNKVGFKYTNSTAHMFYRGIEVGLVPIPPGQVSAGGTEQISSTLQLLADRLITDSNLSSDFRNGSLPFSTTTDLSGRVDILHIFKHHVDASSVCNITISTSSQSISSTVCSYDVKL